MKTSKRAFALHLVQDALAKRGASSDDITHITEALAGAFDDEQAETLKRSETMLAGALEQLR